MQSIFLLDHTNLRTMFFSYAHEAQIKNKKKRRKKKKERKRKEKKKKEKNIKLQTILTGLPAAYCVERRGKTGSSCRVATVTRSRQINIVLW